MRKANPLSQASAKKRNGSSKEAKTLFGLGILYTSSILQTFETIMNGAIQFEEALSNFRRVVALQCLYDWGYRRAIETSKWNFFPSTMREVLCARQILTAENLGPQDCWQQSLYQNYSDKIPKKTTFQERHLKQAQPNGEDPALTAKREEARSNVQERQYFKIHGIPTKTCITFFS